MRLHFAQANAASHQRKNVILMAAIREGRVLSRPGVGIFFFKGSDNKYVNVCNSQSVSIAHSYPLSFKHVKTILS